VLWTDGLLFLLVALTLGFAMLALHRPHLAAPWRRVARSRVGMGAAVLLGLYLTVGLLDSVHFHPRLPEAEGNGDARYATEVLSLLDLLLTPLRTHQEKTYSAPLATHLYTRETVEQADGRTRREYPRLKYGGAHLRDPERERLPDLLATAGRGLLQGLALWGLLTVGLLYLLARRADTGLGLQARRVLAGTTGIPWLTLLLVVGGLLLVGGAAGQLALKYHLLGTDKVGEDVLYQALKSVRTGLMIGTLTTLVMLPAALLLGLMAGYFRGWVDDVIQYLYTTLSSIPDVLLIAAAILMLQVYMGRHAEELTSLVERADLRLLFLCLILGVTSWTGLCRLLRGETLKLRELDYVQAAQAFGVGPFTILYRHIVPNVLHLVLIRVVLDFSGLVLAEAVLSYVNIGVDPTTNSWGNMINSARLELAREPMVWWSLATAFLFMFTLVLAANLFADVVRDALDPRLQHER